MAAQTPLFSVNIDNVANLFVCLGNDRRGQNTPDGETWTPRTLTTSTNYSGPTFGENSGNGLPYGKWKAVTYVSCRMNIRLSFDRIETERSHN
jgi:hypothetical protein